MTTMRESGARTQMRTEAQAVIIGGGVAGCSIAYHLTQMGWRDIVLVERGTLTGGSTHRAAGLVGQLRGTINLTRMIMYGVDLYGRLAAETGIDPDWRQVGSLRLASSPLRMEEIRRQVAQARAFGLDVEVLTPQQAVARCPIISDRDLIGAAYIPTDGRIDPSGLTYALADGARRRGCEISPQTTVTGLTVHNGRVEAVITTRGTIRAPVVVCAAGVWSWHIGQMIGVAIPIVPIEHQYMVTVPFDVPRDLPVFRDPDLRIYGREEVGGLVVGGYEGNPVPCGPEPIPAGLDPVRMAPNWDRFESLANGAITRIPGLSGAGVRKLMIGPETFTPDGEFLLGETPEVRGFFVAGGSPGIATGGGLGKVMAEWIVEGRPSVDIWRADLRRFGAHYGDRGYAATRAVEVYSRNYTVHLPLEEWESARPLRTSPPYPRLAALGAVFGEKAGWERPNWFRANETGTPTDLVPTGWIRHNWSPAIPAEHTATREHAGLFDFSSFSKFQIDGPGALGALQWLTANDVDKAVGAVTYTQMLNPRGGVECDLTVTRLGADRFFIVTGSAFGIHDFDWIRRHLPADGSVTARDITAELGCIGLWGPRAREILQGVCDDDLSNTAFPYMTCREIYVAGVPVRALRVTYVGEAGCELYVPLDGGLAVWDTLWEAGKPRGLRAVGYRAVDSLRLEKGYRYWSADVTPDYTPYEAGQGYFVKLDRKDFQGREALLRQREEGLTRKLCCLVLADNTTHPLGNEPVLLDGRVVTRTTSGGIGYTVRESIAYAYLPMELTAVGTEVGVEVDGRRVSATVQREPRFDPANSRIKS
ncbi:MAG TPA: FAD-dependent oxidoreductase [bacterium]|jgi:4-methylaminobutanoate oxidase (formaldehyde-forming)|nr:FAD-dependent oxidoreductase [bacterium]